MERVLAVILKDSDLAKVLHQENGPAGKVQSPEDRLTQSHPSNNLPCL